MFSVRLLYIYEFVSVVMKVFVIVVAYFALRYSPWFQGYRWLRLSTSCGPYSSIFRQTTSHCHMVFVDEKLLVLCVTAIDPLQGNIYLCSWEWTSPLLCLFSVPTALCITTNDFQCISVVVSTNRFRCFLIPAIISWKKKLKFHNRFSILYFRNLGLPTRRRCELRSSGL